jgi:3-methyladenine DNA glycosylase AlkD
MTLEATMRELEKAGSEQTRKTYRRHGADEPLFGVSFATFKVMTKKIGVDHELALALWDTGNLDARILAIKIADPERISSADLDRWASANLMRMCTGYVSSLAVESAHGSAKAKKWLASSDEGLRAMGWSVVAQLASIDESLADSWFVERIAQIEKSIHSAPSGERYAMNNALIGIGGRNAALRKAATAAAKRIGVVEVDHGDTDCKTPEAVSYIAKMWERSKKFDSPAAAERARESMRTRC